MIFWLEVLILGGWGQFYIDFCFGWGVMGWGMVKGLVIVGVGDCLNQLVGVDYLNNINGKCIDWCGCG